MNDLVVVIMLIKNQDSLVKALSTLSGYNLGGNFHVLCLVNEASLYMEARVLMSSLGVFNDNELLVEYVETEELSFGDAKRFLEKVSLVFLWDGSNVVGYQGINKLGSDFSYHTTAGVISGNIKSEDEVFFTADNLYAKELVCSPIKLSNNRYERFDVCRVASAMTSYDNFMSFDWKDGFWGYCLHLRQLGYMNYINKEVEVQGAWQK